MEWNRSETLALANHQCSYCHGMGLLTGKRGNSSPCNCVFRSIFRACLERFQHCEAKEKYVSKVTLTFVTGRVNRMTWGRRDEEYQADFFLVSKRHLDEEEFAIFKYHFLYGADWKLCCKRLNLDRGTFFHSVYRIQQRLGRVFRELAPYPLFPLDEYFASSERRMVEPILLPIRPSSRGPLVPPLRVHEPFEIGEEIEEMIDQVIDEVMPDLPLAA